MSGEETNCRIAKVAAQFSSRAVSAKTFEKNTIHDAFTSFFRRRRPLLRGAPLEISCALAFRGKGMKKFRVAHAPAGAAPREPFNASYLRSERKRGPHDASPEAPRARKVVLHRKTIKGVAHIARFHPL